MRQRGEGARIVAVDDQPRHLVALVGNQQILKESLERHIGQTDTGGHALAVGLRGEAGQAVARARRRCPRHQRAQAVKVKTEATDCRLIGHLSLPGAPRRAA